MNKPVNCGCGGKPVVEKHQLYEEQIEDMFIVRCTKCDIQTSPEYKKEEVIEVWNRAMGGVVTYPCTTPNVVYTSNCTIINTTDPIEDFHPVYDYMIGKERTAKAIEHDASITVTDGYKYHRSEYLCGACKKKILGGDKYCSHCGAKLDWSRNEQ